MSTKHYCDRCGSELEIKSGRYEVIFNKATAEDQWIENAFTMDLCGFCVRAIKKGTNRAKKGREGQ